MNRFQRLLTVFFILMTPLMQGAHAMHVSYFDQVALVTAYARGVATSVPYITHHSYARSTRDILRILDSFCGVGKQGIGLNAHTMYRLLEIVISGISLKVLHGQRETEACVNNKQNHNGLCSGLLGVLFGIAEGWQAVRLAQGQFGKVMNTKNDRLCCLSYEQSKLALIRSIEGLVKHSPLCETLSEESKGKMLLWGAALIANLDRLLMSKIDFDKLTSTL